MQLCSKCGVNPRVSYDSRCRECFNDYHREWRKNNLEKSRTYWSNWYKNHPERAKRYYREGCRNNPEQARLETLRSRASIENVPCTLTLEQLKEILGNRNISQVDFHRVIPTCGYIMGNIEAMNRGEHRSLHESIKRNSR